MGSEMCIRDRDCTFRSPPFRTVYFAEATQLAKAILFDHRGTLFWPPPVRLFAQPTHAREASRQHPAGDVDAYAHTHAHADELWGRQYENAVPVPRVLWRGRTDLTEVPGTGMNVVQAFFVRVRMLCRTHISSGHG